MIRYNPSPSRSIDPNEPYLLAGYTCNPEGSPARIINKTGNPVFDLITPNGVPLIGYNNGILSENSALNSWSCAAGPATGAVTYRYRIIHRQDVAPAAADRLILYNAVNHYFASELVGLGAVYFFTGIGSSISPFTAVGRGECVWDATYANGTLTLYCNGRQVDQDVVASVAPAGGLYIGYHGETTEAKVFSASATAAQVRSEYVRDHARRVIWQWTPGEDGEGPVGGILTGAVGHNWTCPLGAATMQFVWRPDLSDPNGGRLALTNSVVDTARIDFEIGPRPVFGSWLVEWTVRDPATDSLQVALNSIRGQDYTAAGSNAYWIWSRLVAGPWFRTSLFLANGAQIDAADCAFPGPIAGDRMKALLTHHPDGSWQVYIYCRSLGSWYWSVAAPADVTVLSTSCLTVAPRGAYVERVTFYNGELTPHELEIVTP